MSARLLGAIALASASACASPFRWEITSAVEIDAPPARVWETLVDLPAYREWNPFIVDARGKVAVGETLSLEMSLRGGGPTTIEPELLVVDPARELRWKGKLWIPGLFEGEHYFLLTPTSDGRTQVEHGEAFRGLLLPIARVWIYDATVEAFHAMNDALAARAATGSSTRETARWSRPP